MCKNILLGLVIVLIFVSQMTSACTKTTDNKEVSTNDHAEERINSCISEPITDEDLEVVYDSLSINRDTNIEDIVNVLGLPDDYEDNNKGYISGNAKYRRWNLSYPNYSNPQIRIIVLSVRKYVGEEVTDGEGYVVGIYLESFETQKGLKVGDQLDKVLELYGKPENNQNGILRYSKENSHLEIKLSDDNKTVESIFIDYNMEKSVEEQDGAND